MDVDHLEKAEQQLDAFIERRPREAKDAEEVEEMWEESVRRDPERRREENRALWVEFHTRLAASHARISADHEARGEALLGEGAAVA